jgi:hypothetical protein
VVNQGLHGMVADSRRRDNERKIAAAELRRLAKAAGRAEGSPAPWHRAIPVRKPGLPAIGYLAGAWRTLGRGFVAVVGRHVPA